MLKITGSSELAQRDDNHEVVGGGDYDRNLSKSKKSKNAKFGIQMLIGATEEPTFLNFGTREAFKRLR